jgi:hypothetical protein
LLIILEKAMKHILLLLAIAITVAGCKKIKDNAYVDAGVPFDHEFTTPGTGPSQPLPLGGTTLDFPKVAFATNSQNTLEQYEINANKLSSVTLTNLSLYTASPHGAYFDYVDSIQLFVSTRSHDEVLVGYKYGVPKGVRKIDFDVNNEVNLKNYFLQDTMYFRIRTHINATPHGGELLHLTSVFRILANPLL